MSPASTRRSRRTNARRAARQAVASSLTCARHLKSCAPTKQNCYLKPSNRFKHRNQHYSVIALTDGAGAIEERYTYSVYGEPVFVNATGAVLANSAKDNRYAYTGRERDEELSLYHFRARMHDAESGWFYGRDPLTAPRTRQNLYVARFASRAALDPEVDDWVCPWDPNAQWWWPFDDESNGPILDAITGSLA